VGIVARIACAQGTFMTTKSVELAIFWLPLIAGILLGGIAGSAWYGGDKIPAIWIAFVGCVCFLLTAALQLQQYAYARLLQPEIELSAPAQRSILRWDPPQEFNFTTRPEDQPLGAVGQSHSPIFTLKNKATIAAQDLSVVWEIAAYDVASLIQSSARLQLYGATQNSNMIILGTVMNPQGSPQGVPFTFPTSFKNTVPLPFLTRASEAFIPYDVWSQAVLFFMATLPNNRGDRSDPVTMTASVKWNIPEGSKNARFRVIAVATNDAPVNAKGRRRRPETCM